MKSVIQDETIHMDVTFYNVEPAQGGVPTDPDNYLHTWEITDPSSSVTGISLLEGGLWPSQTDFYFSIVDSGTDFEIKGYSDIARTIEIVSTGALAYGVYVEQALAEVGGSGFAGTVTVTFAGGIPPVILYPFLTYNLISGNFDGSCCVVEFDNGGGEYAYSEILDGSLYPSNVMYAKSITGLNYVIVGSPLAAFQPEPMELFSADNMDFDGGSNIDIILYSVPGSNFSTVLCSNLNTAAIVAELAGLAITPDAVITDVFIATGATSDYTFNAIAFGDPFTFWGGDLANGERTLDGTADFSISDIGQTEPTYQIFDQDNTEVVSETICTDRESAGKYFVDYAVALDAVPGENWRIVWRGTINGVDSFLQDYFRVIDAAVAEEENALIVTLSELKNSMKKTNDNEDEFLRQLLLSASQTIEEYTQTRFHVEEKTIRLHGNDRDKIHIDNDGPIYSITSLKYLNGTAWSDFLDIVDFSGWFIYDREDVFPEGQNNIELQYRYGYDKAPRQIKQAVIQLVKYWYAYQNRTGVLSDVVGGGLRVNYADLKDDLPPEVKALIRPYRRYV